MSDNLIYKKKNIFEENPEHGEIFAVSDRYIEFLNTCKTERACTRYFVEQAKKTDLRLLTLRKI